MAKPKIVKCCSNELDSLNVSMYVKSYLRKTNKFREKLTTEGISNGNQFFLSWATKKPVTKQTIARWLKTSLELAGIDTNQFTGHSFRGAGLSAAQAKGANISQIVAHGDWKNVTTFKSHYSAPSQDSNIGRIILNQYSKRWVELSTSDMFYINVI